MGPRVFCIPATESSIVAVVRRGPSSWSHVGRWDPDAGTYEPGSWLRARIYPQRSDLSPDGRWFAHLVLKGGATWDVGSTYIAVSRLPWLTALVAWSTCGTWTRGIQFVADRRSWVGDPDVGDPRPLRQRYGLAGSRPETFAVERRRGWRETADTPVRAPFDAWDERRADQVVMEKPHPVDPDLRLLVSGTFAAFREMSPTVGPPRYVLASAAQGDGHLDGIQWADWDRRGRLLVATDTGQLQVREAPFGAVATRSVHDLAALRPEPVQPPAEASRW